MGNPRLEDGFTRIANELLDAILLQPLSKRELKVILAIVRQTYGYQKTSDAISIVQLSSITGIDRANVSRTVDVLINKLILKRIGKGRISHGKHVKSIGVNKHYNRWLTDAKTAHVSKQHICQNNITTDAKTTSVTDAKTAHTKEKKEKKERKNDKNKIKLPSWLSIDVWQEFKNYRKYELKSPLGKIGESRLLKKLTQLKEAGNDPIQVITNSMENGWKGLFEVKNKANKFGNNYSQEDEYEKYRKIGNDLNIFPHATESAKDYVKRVKNAVH